MKARILTLLTAVVSAACATSDPRENVSDDLETPAFTTDTRDGAFEVRRYAPRVVASTTVAGDRGAASRQGFRILAGYIFGGNQAREEVAMTAPVDVTPRATRSEKIAMTAPVDLTPQEGERWEITFTMPSRWTLDRLPVPDDDRVQLRNAPGACVAAVVFDGTTSDGRVAEQTGQLRSWMDARGLNPAGAPTLAQYNDPFTFPWNRRNEILIPVNDCDDLTSVDS